VADALRKQELTGRGRGGWGWMHAQMQMAEQNSRMEIAKRDRDINMLRSSLQVRCCCGARSFPPHPLLSCPLLVPLRSAPHSQHASGQHTHDTHTPPPLAPA